MYFCAVNKHSAILWVSLCCVLNRLRYQVVRGKQQLGRAEIKVWQEKFLCT